MAIFCLQVAQAQDAEILTRPWPGESADLPARLAVDAEGFVVALKDPSDAAERYRALFGDRSKKTFAELARSTDASLGLQAAWELAAYDASSEYVGPWTGLELFAAEVKRRLGVQAPSWWLRCLATRLSAKPWPVEVDFLMRFGDPMVGRLEGKAMVLTLDGAPRIFPLDEDAFFAHAAERWHPEQKVRRVAWAAGVGREYLALLPPNAEEFPLRCHEAGGGALLWRSSVWGMARIGVAGNGTGAVYVVIVPTERGPAVFGTDGWGDYVELFDAKTGRPLARFCSTYWLISDYVRSKQ